MEQSWKSEEEQQQQTRFQNPWKDLLIQIFLLSDILRVPNRFQAFNFLPRENFRKWKQDLK